MKDVVCAVLGAFVWGHLVVAPWLFAALLDHSTVHGAGRSAATLGVGLGLALWAEYWRYTWSELPLSCSAPARVVRGSATSLLARVWWRCKRGVLCVAFVGAGNALALVVASPALGWVIPS